MNISEHLASFVSKTLQCDTVFTLTGGGAMFLNDAFGNCQGINCIYAHHEQAAAMAALGFSKSKGLGVCVTTTGCGATNALTGLLDSWQDSQPVLFVSGQVKKKETTFFSGLPLRSFGVQELDIIPIVKPITKKAICLGSKEEYLSCLEKIPEWLFGDRPGPVWIDIPMDIQSQELTAADLKFLEQQSDKSSSKMIHISEPKMSDLEKVKNALSKSEKPVFLVGNGLRLSQNGHGIDEIQKLCRNKKIPLVSTYLAADFFSDSCINYLGVAGLKAARRANIALYNSDLIVAIGTRLATSVIGFEYEKFAPNAKVFVVDIDEVEHSKATRSAMNFIKSDAAAFISALGNISWEESNNKEKRFEWLDKCKRLKKILPIQEQFSPEDSVSIYDAIATICRNFGEKDMLVSDAGSAYYVASIMFSKSENQRYITSGAQADMGFSLPAAIGAAASLSGIEARIHSVTGDGSFQLNLQELQTLITNRLPITLYILNNNGYLSIKATQAAFFAGRECGTGPNTGVDFPDIKSLCDAYKIEYRKADSCEALSEIVNETKVMNSPVICEVICPENEAIIPRTKTIKKPDGTLESAPLCAMQPDLAPELVDMLSKMNLICHHSQL